MPLPVFDTQDAIPDAFRSEYTEKDGKWIPKPDGNADAVAAQNRRLLDEKKRIEAEKERYEKALGGRKLEEVEELFAAQRTADEERQKKAGEFDKLLEKRIREKVDEYEPKVKAGELAARELADLKFDIAVRELAAKAGIPEKNLKAVVRIVKDEHLTMEDGKLVVLDAAGDARSISAEKFFNEEFKTDYAELYAASGGSGGGAGAGSGSGRTTGKPGAIDARDQNAILDNLDGIAKGKVPVTL